jgi:hypothetical protein
MNLPLIVAIFGWLRLFDGDTEVALAAAGIGFTLLWLRQPA